MANQHKIGSHKTNVYRTPEGRTNVKYWNTDVVSIGAKDITLDTGGWSSNTTRTRMNQTSNQMGLGFNVFQKKFKWFVTDNVNKITIPFNNDKVKLKR